jgi:hypothetical protein
MRTRLKEPTGDSVVVYTGREFIGAVRRRADLFEARDPDGRKVGVFRTLREASAALLRKGGGQ